MSDSDSLRSIQKSENDTELGAKTESKKDASSNDFSSSQQKQMDPHSETSKGSPGPTDRSMMQLDGKENTSELTPSNILFFCHFLHRSWS